MVPGGRGWRIEPGRRALLPFLAAVVLLAAGLVALGLPPLRQAAPEAAAADVNGAAGSPTLSVSGSGSVRVAPDWARLQVGVRTQAATAQAAAQQNTAAIARVIDALHQAGVPDKEIQTSDYSLGPAFEPGPSSSRPSGYQAIHMLSVGVPADRAGAVLDAATEAGANQVGGVTFDVRDRDSLERQATNQAIDQARQAAEAAAAHAGLRLAGIRSLQVGSSGPVPLAFSMRAPAVKEAASVPVQPGELTVTATVSVVFDVAPAP